MWWRGCRVQMLTLKLGQEISIGPVRHLDVGAIEEFRSPQGVVDEVDEKDVFHQFGLADSRIVCDGKEHCMDLLEFVRIDA